MTRHADVQVNGEAYPPNTYLESILLTCLVSNKHAFPEITKA
jgi:hypothetical protein